MMKYFLAIALIAAVASAAVRPSPVSAEIAEIQEIIAAIQSPSTDPATAAALEQMLLDALGLTPEPVAVGPAIVESPLEGISVGPAIIDFPLPDGGAVAEEPAVIPTPVVVAPNPAPAVVAPAASTPLVQIILNINQAAAESSPIAVAPVDVIAPEIKPEPVHVVESAPEPVQVVEVAPEPVQVVEVAPEPVQVAPEPSPISPPIAVNPIGVVAPEIEPIQIGVPVIPEAAVVLPEELN